MSRVESFLVRWSRRKTAAAAEAAKPQPSSSQSAPSAPLPDPETLNFDSDFSAFLGAQVDAGVKYRALSKLFHSPQFNVMDGLDVYIDDYTRPDPVSEEMLKDLAHVRDLLAEKAPATESAAPAAAPAAAAEAMPETVEKTDER